MYINVAATGELGSELENLSLLFFPSLTKLLFEFVMQPPILFLHQPDLSPFIHNPLLIPLDR